MTTLSKSSANLVNEQEQRAHANTVLAAYIFAYSAQWNVTENRNYWTTTANSLRKAVVEQLHWVAQETHTFAYKIGLLEQLETLVQNHVSADKETRLTQEAEMELLMHRITRPARNPYRLKGNPWLSNLL